MASKASSGGRSSKKRLGQMGKGKVVKKPKRAAVATKFNESRRMTGAIMRNIEKQMGHKVQKNGGALSMLKGVAAASRKGTEKPQGQAEDKLDGIKNGEVKADDKAPRFNPKKKFKL